MDFATVQALSWWKIDFEDDYDDNDKYILLVGVRDETDKEYENRMNMENLAKKARKLSLEMKAKTNEENERKLYEKLKFKYEKQANDGTL